MRGSLRKLGEGRWQLRVYAGRDPLTDRKRYLGRVHRGGRRSAEDALRALVAEVEAGQHTKPTEDPTVEELMEQWLAQHPDDRTAHTLSRLHIVPKLGDARVTALRLRHVDTWAAELAAGGLAASSVHRIHTVLHAALEQAVRWELIVRNPATGARLPRVVAPEHQVPGPEDLARVLRVCDGDVHTATLVRLAAATGARRGQLVGLQWADVDGDAAVITFRRSVAKVAGGCLVKDTKTGAVIRVPVGPATLEAVDRYRRHRQAEALKCGIGRLAPGSFVFAQDPAGERPWYPDTASSRWRAVRKKAGLDGVRLHDLRHAQGTGLIAAGVDVRTVASRLGHSSPTVTLGVYAHPVTEAERKAAEVVEGWLG